MNVLVTGRGTSGSWAIRGEQLGRAIGATVIARAELLRDYDLGVVVKRAPPDLLQRARAAKLPLVYDVVDGWPQPTGNLDWKRGDCISWLKSKVAEIKPIALVTATQVMEKDCAVIGLPVLTLPHHARPGQALNPIREQIRTVGYEGAPQYLGRWHQKILDVCAKNEWRFVINPPALADLDLLFIVRDCAGYPALNWKSNVKLANAQATGTPCIINQEAGYEETQSGGEEWVSKPDDIARACEALSTQAARKEASCRLKAGAIPLDTIADVYRSWLHSLRY